LVQFSAVLGDGALTSAIAAAVMARSVVREIFSINFFELTFSHAASIMGDSGILCETSGRRATRIIADKGSRVLPWAGMPLPHLCI
jgi:hypothetical protein